MRYAASEKLEIIRIVEQSHLPVRRTLQQMELELPKGPWLAGATFSLADIHDAT